MYVVLFNAYKFKFMYCMMYNYNMYDVVLPTYILVLAAVQGAQLY